MSDLTFSAQDVFIGVIAAIFVVALILQVRALYLSQTKNKAAAAPPQAAPTCETCEHWDLEEGQAAMRTAPVFMQAAAIVAPSEMGRRVERSNPVRCRICAGTGQVGTMRYTSKKHAPEDAEEPAEITKDCDECFGSGETTDDELSPPSAPYKAQWAEFGACLRDPDDAPCVWKKDTCTHHKPLIQLRKSA